MVAHNFDEVGNFWLNIIAVSEFPWENIIKNLMLNKTFRQVKLNGQQILLIDELHFFQIHICDRRCFCRFLVT